LQHRDLVARCGLPRFDIETRSRPTPLNYLRDVTSSADDQSSTSELAAGRIAGSYSPWLQSGHVWSLAAKGARGRGRWVKKPGPKGRAA
jgi:hypothetical protein